MTPEIHPEFDHVAQRLAGIRWAAACGQSLPESLTPFCRSVGSFTAARDLMGSEAWESWSSERDGNLSEYLDDRHHRRYQDWSGVVQHAKKVMSPHESAIIMGLRAVGLTGDLPLEVVRWALVGALTCAGFMDCKPPTDALQLLSVYEAGHLPVGWDAQTQHVLVY